jgi:phosphoglucosamine mutase
MTQKLFGTDGIRAKTNTYPMTADIVLKVAMATASLCKKNTKHPLALIGKDTRLSGYMLEPALTAGLISMGVDVVLLGPLPTPAIGMLTRSMRADIGIMISASHNPFQDNGIKIFGADGYKISDVQEQFIEKCVNESSFELALPENIGRAKRLEDAPGRYIEFVKNTFPKHLNLQGLKIVVDCAEGASYKVAPTVLWELGAEVIVMANNPTGTNINQNCGATKPEKMCQMVLEHQADLGIAFDGDADRVVFSDEKGQLIDGDQIMAIIATFFHKNQQLKSNSVVATIMSNLGLELYLKKLGITLERTKVGDRFVLERMREIGANVGGEQSGHILLTDYATTGDGLIAALQALAVLRSNPNQKMSELAHMFDPFPQYMENVRFEGKSPLNHDSVQSIITKAQQKLGTDGRLVIRPSGTEPVIRVMAEGTDESMIQSLVKEITSAMEKSIC